MLGNGKIRALSKSRDKEVKSGRGRRNQEVPFLGDSVDPNVLGKAGGLGVCGSGKSQFNRGGSRRIPSAEENPLRKEKG